MARPEFTCLRQVAEPVPLYKTKLRKLKKTNKAKRIRRAAVQTTTYPPLNNQITWRKIPWINLRGHWLQQAGFEIGVRYRIEVQNNKLVLVVTD